MARKYLFRHRRGSTEDWIAWTKDPNHILEDGEMAIEDAHNGMRIIVGDGVWHDHSTFNKLYLSGYAAEYFEWADGNPNNEDRTGKFVTIVDDRRQIKLAEPTDDILGVTSTVAEGFNIAIVSLIGIVTVKHDGTCVKNGYAMVGSNGIATKTTDTFGYKIIDTNEENNTVEIVLGNDSDTIARMQDNMQWGEW